MVMVVSRYIKGTLLDTTNRSFVSTVTLFLFFFSTNTYPRTQNLTRPYIASPRPRASLSYHSH